MNVADSRPVRSVLASIIDHLRIARVPALIVIVGWYMAFRVDQVQELFVLLVQSNHLGDQLWALAMAGALGIAVWHTLRTAYRFDLPAFESLSQPRGEWLRSWLPRLFGAAVPLLMALGCHAAARQADKHLSLSELWIVAAFLGEFVLLLLFFWRRRTFLRRFMPDIDLDPSLAPRITSWSQIRKTHQFYRAVLGLNVVAIGLAAFLPGTLGGMGTPALILFAAAFAVMSGFYLTINAYRWRVPLLVFLAAIAILFELFTSNDNHLVRLYPDMNSDVNPDWQAVDPRPPLEQSYRDYVAARARGDDEPIFAVSAEGGGIRAAAWTAMVLTNIELASEGNFSRSIIAGSGVSGGSLGLALFAAMVKAEREGLLDRKLFPEVATSFFESDFLAPTVEAMLFTESTQAFFPTSIFVDRGQRLEMSWERAWRRAMRRYAKADACASKGGKENPELCDAFARPWQNLWNGSPAPPLFLNATIVESGQRFVQHPFRTISTADGFSLDPLILHGSSSSTFLIPASAPLSAVVHNSARFTYVSPAGRLLFRSQHPAKESGTEEPGHVQLVDGGYFENSATTTLLELAEVIAETDPKCGGRRDISACNFHFIHISNDPGVPAILGDSLDACTRFYRTCSAVECRAIAGDASQCPHDAASSKATGHSTAASRPHSSPC